MPKLVLAALLALPLFAQAQVIPDRVRLLTSGRYIELERLVEKEIANEAKPKSARLMPLCLAYGKLKRYNKTASCLERLDANIKAGDIAANDIDEMNRNSPLMAGLAHMGSALMGGRKTLEGTVVPFTRLMQAELATELREYDKAIASAKEGLPAIMPIGFIEDRISKVMILTALGVAQALGGYREDAAKTAAELEDIGTHYPYGGIKQAKWAGAVRIHVALGNFKRAQEIFDDENPTSHGLFMSFAYAVGGAVAGIRSDESLTAWNDLPLEFLMHKVAFENGKVKEAKEGFDKLLERPNTKENGEIYWLLLNDRGRIAEMEGDLPGAVEFWRRAIEVIEEQRSTINTEASKIGFVGDKQAVYRALVAGLFTLNRQADAFEFVERSKARALVDLLADKKDFAVAAPNPEAINKLLASAQQQELESRVQVAAAPQAAAQPAQRNLVVSGARKVLQEQAPELASLVAVSSTPLAEIQSRIPEDEALLEYYYDEKAVYAFVLTRAGLQARKLEVAGMEADIRALRQAIENPRNDDYQATARKLHARLIAPLNDLIAGKKLLIVAHGALHYMPFAALHDGAAFLLEKHSLRFLPSASVIRYLRVSQPGNRAGVLAFGNPDLGDPRFDLRFAQDEAVAIVQKVPQSRALLRKEASVSAFSQFASGFSTLHFATHGEFNSDAPLRSALMLAKEGDSDGLLTVSRLYSTRIAADLVTLSACETGLGKIASGDDVVGLTRGFLYAGASTVVASLWKVDDQATAALMTGFYDELKGGDKREALRKAQLAAREKFPHPFFWAAFQLTGQAN
jgi:CHAT domain-containing protein